MAIKRQETSAKHKYLYKFFGNLVVMKACKFDKRFLQTTVHEKYLTRETLLRGISEGKLFGTVVCDVKVPENEKDYFAEMPPVFKTTQISIDDVGPFMKKLCEQLDEFKTPHRALICSCFLESKSRLLRNFCNGT